LRLAADYEVLYIKPKSTNLKPVLAIKQLHKDTKKEIYSAMQCHEQIEHW